MRARNILIINLVAKLTSFVGFVVGNLVVCILDGMMVGKIESELGPFVGFSVGALVGVYVGKFVGLFVGFIVGTLVGVFVGIFVGSFVGFIVGTKLARRGIGKNLKRLRIVRVRQEHFLGHGALNSVEQLLINFIPVPFCPLSPLFTSGFVTPHSATKFVRRAIKCDCFSVTFR